MTMDKFQMGQTFEQEVVITKDHSVNRMGKEGADVLSTPALLGLMENTCILQSEPYLPEQHTTVGYAVDGLRHVAPTALGEKVQVKVLLSGVDRNRLTYDIEVYEGPDKRIAVANHKRAVIPIQ